MNPTRLIVGLHAWAFALSTWRWRGSQQAEQECIAPLIAFLVAKHEKDHNITDGVGKQPSPLSIDVVVAEDRRSVALGFKKEGETAWTVEADAASVELLLAGLGNARGQMLEPIPMSLSNDVHPLAAFDPRWYVLPDTENRFATFWIRHPGFGWSGYGFPRHEAGNISKFLRKVTSIASTRDTQSPSATSFGGDKFLLTTEGLGFYYYGEGEKRIGPNPFEQIEFDSDRAAGVVAGSIVERRLEQALRSRFRTDSPAISDNLFRSSGALGPFSTKIDLAYLSGMLSEKAHKDLVNLKNIRNDFAHNLDLDLFDVASIKDRCNNFVMIDRYVGPIPSEPRTAPLILTVEDTQPYFGLPDHQQKLSDPRFRYTMTAQIFSFLLGQGSDRPNAPLPFL